MQKRLQIISDPVSIRKIENLIDELSEKHNIESDLYGKVLVATVEAVNNAIIHGNKLDRNKIVNVNVFTSRQKIKINVRDEGRGFDYNKVPDPTSPENIENIHGRGVFLMQKLSDGIEFRHNGSEVELTFYII